MQTDCCFPVKSLHVYVKEENLESTKWHLAQNVTEFTCAVVVMDLWVAHLKSI